MASRQLAKRQQMPAPALSTCQRHSRRAPTVMGAQRNRESQKRQTADTPRRHDDETGSPRVHPGPVAIDKIEVIRVTR